MSEQVTNCGRGGCGAPILWLVNEKTSKRAPIDSDPVPHGNIAVLDDRGLYMVLAGNHLELARKAGTPLHLNHFVTCANPPRRST